MLGPALGHVPENGHEAPVARESREAPSAVSVCGKLTTEFGDGISATVQQLSGPVTLRQP